jgi:hypothetical protein
MAGGASAMSNYNKDANNTHLDDDLVIARFHKIKTPTIIFSLYILLIFFFLVPVAFFGDYSSFLHNSRYATSWTISAFTGTLIILAVSTISLVRIVGSNFVAIHTHDGKLTVSGLSSSTTEISQILSIVITPEKIVITSRTGKISTLSRAIVYLNQNDLDKLSTSYADIKIASQQLPKMTEP